MPPLIDESMKRLDQLLDKPLRLWAFDLKEGVQSKEALLGLDLTKGRVLLVGRSLIWVLGIKGLNECGNALLGKKRFNHHYNIKSLADIAKKESDSDFRYDTAQNEDPVEIAENLLKKLAKKFNTSKYSEESLCNELRKKEGGPFSKFDPFYDIGKTNFNKNAFLIHQENDELDFDLMIAPILDHNTLLTLQDFTLDITDYIQGKTKVLRPTGKANAGWQCIIALLGKLVQFQCHNQQAWVRAEGKIVEGFRSLSAFPKEVYAKMNLRVVGEILKRLKINKNPVASCMLMIDSCSNLLHQGFHPTDVDQVCQSFKNEEKLPSTLMDIRKATKQLPIDLVIAVLRISDLSKAKIVERNEITLLEWVQEGQTCTIQQDIKTSLKVLIDYEMKMQSETTSNKFIIFREFLLQMGFKVNSEKNKLLILQIIQTKFPELIEFACDQYLKNREHNSKLAIPLFNFMMGIDRKIALNSFGTHLNHVKSISKEHLESFEKILPTLQSPGSPASDLPSINHIVSMGQVLAAKGPNYRDTVTSLIEKTVTDFLNNQRPESAAFLLTLSAQSNLSPGNSSLWIEACQELYMVQDRLIETVNLWTLAERQGIWKNALNCNDYKAFLVPFCEALYKKNTPDCVRIAHTVLDWLSGTQQHDEFTKRMGDLLSLRQIKMAEQKTSENNVEKLFNSFSLLLITPESKNSKEAKQSFLCLIDGLSEQNPSSEFLAAELE